MKFKDFRKVCDTWVILYKNGNLLAEGNTNDDNLNIYKEEKIIKIYDDMYTSLEVILKDDE